MPGVSVVVCRAVAKVPPVLFDCRADAYGGGAGIEQDRAVPASTLAGVAVNEATGAVGPEIDERAVRERRHRPADR